jgi:hypothetical protein
MLDTQTKESHMTDELKLVKQAIHALWLAQSKEPVGSDTVLLQGLKLLYTVLDAEQDYPAAKWNELYSSDIQFARDIVEAVNG